MRDWSFNPYGKPCRWTRRTGGVLLILAALLWGGCEAFIPVAAPPPKAKAPFYYEPLGVHNACLVESIHFYDLYRQKMGKGGWVRVLQWGHQDGDSRISSGHAVVIYGVDGKLFGYDINYGFWALAVPFEKREDLTEIAPAVERHYPQFKTVFERYREDWVHYEPGKPPEFLFYHRNADIRDATRVASELGRFRNVSILEFDYVENGKKQTTAAVAFAFDGRLCVYIPRQGTHVTNLPLYDVRRAIGIEALIRRAYPGTGEIRSQPKRYILVPPNN